MQGDKMKDTYTITDKEKAKQVAENINSNKSTVKLSTINVRAMMDKAKKIVKSW
jgi:hypothetical protein